jgi:hypothetical protein
MEDTLPAKKQRKAPRYSFTTSHWLRSLFHTHLRVIVATRSSFVLIFRCLAAATIYLDINSTNSWFDTSAFSSSTCEHFHVLILCPV